MNWATWLQHVQIDALEASRDITDRIPAPAGTNAFIYGSSFLNIEQCVSGAFKQHWLLWAAAVYLCTA